ncbi:MAG: pyridoxal-phosphate dependent enzyme [Bacteroidota bacterium]
MRHIPVRTDPAVRKRTAFRCRQRNIRIPTLAQMRDPGGIPGPCARGLEQVGLWDVNPLNLYRITWKNDPEGRGFGGVNFLELPCALTGVEARIVGLVGKYFPTGAHKVGAAFGCLIPRLVSGEFDPERHRAVWPSTGNFCRGGAFDCSLLGCTAVAVLPEEMSSERFAWLRSIGAEIIATPGCESNVKEIYDACRVLRADRANMIFNQFEEFGNPLWHHAVTGPACEEVLRLPALAGTRPAAFISATGSAGTIAAGDHLKRCHPDLKIVAAEALQCPTLLMNGFGGHRIEGIGDKHIPWVHNTRNTDAVAAVDDEDCLRLFRLFNEEAGGEELRSLGVPPDVVSRLGLVGISGICNLLAAVKTARRFELGKDDVLLTVFTDSADLYRSRLAELEALRGPYTGVQAARDLAGPLHHQRADFFRELGYEERKAVHNLKYFTWVEQQGKSTEELREQWDPGYWEELYETGPAEFDRLVEEFNADAGW